MSLSYRQNHVHEDHIWQDLSAESDGRLAVFGLTCQLQIIKNLQESGQSAANHRMIVYEHDTNGLGGGICHTASLEGGVIQVIMISVPLAGQLLTDKSAPTASARSRIILKP